MKLTNSPEQGQEIENENLDLTTDEAPTQDGQSETSEPFFSYVGEDGKELSFSTKDELSKAWKDSFMMRSDYTRKTQSLSEEKKKWEEERSRFENDRTSFLMQQKQAQEILEKAKKYNEFLKKNPGIYKDLENRVNQNNHDDISSLVEQMFEEKYGEDMKRWKAEQAQREAEKQREAIEAQLKQQYPDYDSQAVAESFKHLSEGNLQHLLEILYFANKGRISPVEIEKKLTENLAKKQNAGLITSTGNVVASKGNVSARSLEDARRRAHERYIDKGD